MYDKKAAVEAILFANGSPAEPDKIAQAIEMEPSQAEKLILELMDDYEKQERGIRIIKLNKSYQMVSAKKFAPEIRKVMDLRRNTPLSQAALEAVFSGVLPQRDLSRKKADLNFRADLCFTEQPRTF